MGGWVVICVYDAYIIHISKVDVSGQFIPRLFVKLQSL